MEALRVYRGIIFFGVFALSAVAERLFPLRPRRDSTLRRWAVNLSMLGMVAGLVHVLTMPFVLGVLAFADERRLGLLRMFEAPGWLKTVLALALLDYTLYVWHWLNHRVPFFWRFHTVHHIDLDMDVSTGTRFHVGELALSAVYRSLQVVIIGVDLVALVLFEVLVNACSQFHHGNIRLPIRLERALNLITVTPRMHELHHSAALEHTHSNFSTVFSVWDRLHKTMSPYSAKMSNTIGLATLRKPLGLWRTLLVPLKKY